MKKKLVSVLALVLVVCFVWVAQVDAASAVTYDTQQEIEFFFSGVSSASYGNNVFTFDALYNNDVYSLVGLIPNDDYKQLLGCNTGCVTGDSLDFSLFVLFPYNPVTISSVTIYDYPFVTHSNYTYALNPVQVELSFDDYNIVCNGYRIDVTMVVNDPMITISISSGSFDKVIYGMLCPLVTYGLSAEDKSILEQILLGVNNNSSMLDQMQSEQSSYYEDILQSEASDTDVIAEASSKREQFDDIMNEYSSLNADLARPGVDELLPDYSSVVSGFKDDDFNDVFDVFYGNSYIMFMLLASVFFATISFVIFGKKA